MNNISYIKSLKKALKRENVPNAKDIVLEIQSHVQESGSETSLLEMFGAPEVLAKEYADGEKVVQPLAKKAVSFGKKLIVTVCVSICAIVLLAFLIIWWLTKDDFNYADINAPELQESSSGWMFDSTANLQSLELTRAKVVVYWHEQDTIRWNCKGDQVESNISQQQWSILENKCLVFLPANVTTINAKQSELVLVQPQSNLDLDIKQTKLRIANNGTDFRYTVEGDRFRMKELVSISSAELGLNIKAVESVIQQY